jgi:hypothetical protein
MSDASSLAADTLIELQASTLPIVVQSSPSAPSKHHRKNHTIPTRQHAYATLLEDVRSPKRSLSWWRRVFLAYPELRLRRDRGILLIHHLCAAGMTDATILERFKIILAGSTQEQLTATAPQQSVSTPLAILASGTRAAGAIELFLRLCPESAFLVDQDHLTPLQLMCIHRAVQPEALLAFQQYAPAAFTTIHPGTETPLTLWCQNRADTLRWRSECYNDGSVQKTALTLAHDREVDAQGVAVLRILLHINPEASVLVGQNNDWPHQSLRSEDPCVLLILESAMAFPDARSIDGSSVLHWICLASFDVGSRLPMLQRVLVAHSHLANVRSHSELLPIHRLHDVEDATFEQFLLLFSNSSPEMQAEQSADFAFLSKIAGIQTERELHRRQKERIAAEAAAEAALPSTEPSDTPVAPTASTSPSPPFSQMTLDDHIGNTFTDEVEIESQRTDLLRRLLEFHTSWSDENIVTIHPLQEAIQRTSCTIEQLRLLWCATPLRVRQSQSNGEVRHQTILHELIIRLGTSEVKLNLDQIEMLTLAQQFLRFDCGQALSYDIHPRSLGQSWEYLHEDDPDWAAVWYHDPTPVIQDYALLLLPSGSVNVRSVLDSILLHSTLTTDGNDDEAKATEDGGSTLNDTTRELILKPAARRALHGKELVKVPLFLRRLTNMDIPLSDDELQWFADHAPFVFGQVASGLLGDRSYGGWTTIHFLVDRPDCTPNMIRIALNAAVKGTKQEQTELHPSHLRSSILVPPIAWRTATAFLLPLLPLDVLLATAHATKITSTEEEESICEMIHLLLGRDTNGVLDPDLLVQCLAAPPDHPSTPDEWFDRPIHSYLNATQYPGASRRQRIMQLLITGDDTTNSNLLAREVLCSRDHSGQTLLMLLCELESILTLSELDWILSLAPDLASGLFGPSPPYVNPGAIDPKTADRDRKVAIHRSCIKRLAENKGLTLDVWKRVLPLVPDDAFKIGGVNDTCGHLLCRFHPGGSDLILALTERAPFALTLKRTKHEILPMSGLRELSIASFQSMLSALPRELTFDLLTAYNYSHEDRNFTIRDGTPMKSYIEETDEGLFAIVCLQRVPNLKPKQLRISPWPEYLSHLILFAMESEKKCARLLGLLSADDPAHDPASRRLVMNTMVTVALLTGAPTAPRLHIQSSKDSLGWLEGHPDARSHPRSRHRFYENACLFDDMAAATERSLSGSKARDEFLRDIQCGMFLHAAVPPESAVRFAHKIRTYAIETGILLPDSGHSNTPSQFHNRTGSSIVQLDWSSLIHTERGQFIFSDIFMQLIRSKERKLIVKLIHLVSPFRVSSLRCSIHYSSPLHILCSEVRGCRERIFEILLADALQLYNGSYEKVLDELDGDGNSLRSILEHHKNRDLLSHIQYSMNRKSTVGVAAPLHASAAATFFASALGTTESSAPSHSVSVRLRSRSNYLTYDRIVDLSLESCLDQPTSNQPQVDSGKLDFSSIVDSTLARSLSICSLPSLLSSDECSRLLSCTGFNFDSLSGEYHPRQRDSSRLLCHAPQFTEMIWNRLYANSTFTKFLSHQTEIDRRPMGYGTFGLWIPEKINEIVRFSYYQPGSMGFQPHRDAAFVQSTNERSIYTILIYLTQPTDQPSIPSTQATVAASQVNDDVSVVASPSSGSTTFYESTNFMPGGLVRDERPIEVLTIPSTIGRTILFPHELLHSGNPIDTNDLAGKCVIRLDLIFRRSSSSIPLVPLEFHWRHDPNYLRALELFQFAFKLELSGREDEASDAYERSLSLRVAPIMRRAKKPIDRRASPNSSPDDSSSIASNSESSETPNRLSINESSFAFDVNRDCLRLIYSYLNTEDQTSTRATCQRWYAPLSIISNPSANQPQVNPKKSAIKANEALWPQKLFQSKAPLSPVSGGVTSMSSGPIAHPAVSIAVVSSNHMMNAVSSLPSLLQPLSAVINENNPTKIEVQPRSFPPSYYAHLERQAYEHSRLHPTPDVNAYLGSSLSSRLLLFPRLSQVGGISTLMSYPTDFYLRHESACRRVMSLYAALTLSHHLPLIVNLMPNLYETKQRERAWTPLTPKELLEAEKLLAARIVFSYERGGNGSSNGSIDNNDKENDSASHVEWCRFDSLIHGIFHGNHITTNITTIEQFNQQTTDKQPFQSIKLAQRLFTYGERSISSGSERSRWSIALGNGIIPSFYHASMCCSQQHAGRHARHELHCYDKQDMLIRKKAQQAASRRAIRVSNAEEVRTLDLAAKSDLIKTLAHSNTDSSASSSSSANLPIDSSTMDVASTSSSPLPVLITVQSMRSSRFISNFRVSFIGMECI